MDQGRLRLPMDLAVLLLVTVMVHNPPIIIPLHQAPLAPRVIPPTVIGSSHQVPLNLVITSLQATDQALMRRVIANHRANNQAHLQATGNNRSQVTVDLQCTRKLALTANDLSEKTKTFALTAINARSG